jgi:predicted flap endonuclease-1-like 5' DNA nuclease
VEASKKGENFDENTEEEGGEMEKKTKVSRSIERRNRGDNSVNEESVELLAIPGVGPRNLRKLVDKGFQGVAQLKQLYKDKVMIPS